MTDTVNLDCNQSIVSTDNWTGSAYQNSERFITVLRIPVKHLRVIAARILLWLSIFEGVGQSQGGEGRFGRWRPAEAPRRTSCYCC